MCLAFCKIEVGIYLPTAKWLNAKANRDLRHAIAWGYIKSELPSITKVFLYVTPECNAV